MNGETQERGLVGQSKRESMRMSGLTSKVPGLCTGEQSMPNRAVCPANPFTLFPESEIEQSIPQRFVKIAEQYSTRLAVKDEHHEFTYDALNKMANRVAWAILAEGEGRAPTVALLLEHGALAIAALMGVIKAGRAYVPLDASYPRARLEYMLQDSQADVILTDSEKLSLASELVAGWGAEERFRLINVAELDSELPTENPGYAISPDAYAYVLYTSGTTGKPKGVLGDHRQVLCFCRVHINSFHICPQDRVGLVASLCFSGSLTYVFPTLLHGATLFSFDVKKEGMSRMVDWLIRERVSIWGGVPTLYRQMCAMLTEGQVLPDLRIVRLGGDRVEKRDLELFREHFSPNCILRVGYGATEVKIITQQFLNQDSQIDGGIVPAGYAVEGVEIRLLDEQGQPVEVGQVGEIAVKSRYLSPGYWRRPEATQAKFLPDPEGGDARIYLTGDLGRLASDGRLTHMGRKDFQVKIRGYRVEIAEIEAVLIDSVEVKEAVVVVREGRNRDQQLVAYLVPASDRAPTTSSLRRSLGEYLPDYMIPAVFVILDQMPLNANGKIDRQALPPPEINRPELEDVYVAPRDGLERELVEVWEDVLGIEPIGVRDNFFELGGHSLLAGRMFAHIQPTHGKDVSLNSFFQSPTVEELAKALREDEPSASRPNHRKRITDTPLKGLKSRILQVLALYVPGAKTTRVRLHRMRGVKIGQEVFIGLSVILESAYPELVSIGNHVTISVRSVVIAHFRGTARQARIDDEPSVRIEDDVFIGPNVTILPNVKIGRGAVVAAGSVVNRPVPPMTMVQGNPAQVVAECGVPLKGSSYGRFVRSLKFIDG